MTAPDDDRTDVLPAVPPAPAPQRTGWWQRIRERPPWAVPLAVAAWILSFSALTDAALASGYVDGDVRKAWLWAGIIDFSIWVGYVGLRRDPRSVRSWLMLVAGTAATIYFQAHWGEPASWVPPVALLLALWVLERPPAETRPVAATERPSETRSDVREQPFGSSRDTDTGHAQVNGVSTGHLWTTGGLPRRRPLPASEPPAAAPPAPAEPATHAPDGTSVRDRVRALVAETEAPTRTPVLTVAEIARALGANTGTVRNVLRDARREHGIPTPRARPHETVHRPARPSARELNGAAPHAHRET